MTSREALNAYILKLETSHVKWYLWASRFHKFMWNSLKFAPLVLGAVTALIAGLVKESEFQEHGKVWVISLPLIGGSVSTVLTTFRFDQLQDLRARGYLTISTLVEKARIDEAAARTDEECKVIHEKLLESVKDLDKQQQEGAWAILRSPIK